MTIVPLDFIIERDAKNNKKIYKHKHTNKLLTKPILPKNWALTDEFKDVKPQQAPSYRL